MILQKPLIAAAYLCHPPTRPPLNLTQQGAPEGINVFTYEASHSVFSLSFVSGMGLELIGYSCLINP